MWDRYYDSTSSSSDDDSWCGSACGPAQVHAPARLFTEHKTNNAADSTVLAVTRTQRRVFLFSRPSPLLVRRQHMQGVPRTRKGPQFTPHGVLDPVACDSPAARPRKQTSLGRTRVVLCVAAGVPLLLRWLAWKTSPPLIAVSKRHVSLGGVNCLHDKQAVVSLRHPAIPQGGRLLSRDTQRGP
ncbi:hypothetical protein E2C01_055625 [Portunus trituberculatus]|uniref:Uncharacterized protein n=1 Tax=Portunus trituberculatus TaxID=210409 RepID=A0A5B7GN83_PORTR|nr:hypothetical protein [Portunus trituberculatus]